MRLDTKGEDKSLDLRGVLAKPGDLVVVGTSIGSSGGWLDARYITKVENGKVYMKGMRNSKEFEYEYRACSGFLILPKKYRDLLGELH